MGATFLIFDRVQRQSRPILLAAVVWAGCSGQALAAEQIAENPPGAAIQRGGDGPGVAAAVPDAPLVPAVAGEAIWSADIDYIDATIFNPRTGMNDKVRLRGYRGLGTDPDYPFVAPTISLLPGDTFRMTLNNRLPADDPSCADHQTDPNVPHCFNSTNLHAHGLWVSPSGNSDNVLLRINPSVEFQYEYNIPADHPAGTYWYHPHLHGSTALQVSSGMAGALIIRGTRLPTPETPGDIDTLLRHDDGVPFQERVVLLQQIPYACRDAAGRVKTDPPAADTGVWVCEEGDTGTIERYDAPLGSDGTPLGPEQFGPGVWRASGRYTTINGRTVPTFVGASAGKIERWRLIHAGVRDSISLGFQKANPAQVAMATSAAYTAASPEARTAFVDQVCDGVNIAQHAFAEDGHTRDRLVEQTKSILHPGYRQDLLIAFPTEGLYCIVDGDLPAGGTASQQAKSRQLLGFVQVGEWPGLGGLGVADHLKQELKIAATRFMPGAVSQKITDDLDRGLVLTAFEPLQSLLEEEPDGEQTVSFRIGAAGGQLAFQIGKLDASGQPVDLASYDPLTIHRTLQLGAVDQWKLKSAVAGHPFHIHVNPFQIVEIIDRNGNDVSSFEPGNTSPYARLKGVWKDTLFIAGPDAAGPGPTYVLKTRYRRYIGDFVLHCHILDHEDKGMMQNVRIALPDGKGGVAHGHH